MQYFAEYVLGWVGPSNMKADKGTIVHKVMEIMAHTRLAQQKGEKSFTDDVCGKVLVNKYDINKLIEKVFGHYTKLITHHNWSESDYKDCKDWVWKALLHNGGAFDPRKRDIVAAEPHFDFTINQPWALYDFKYKGQKVEGCLALKGTIDLITEVAPGIYEIVDWKTGRRLNWSTGAEKTQENLQDDPQLRIYHYAAHQLFPNIDQVLVTIYYINDGGPFTICFNKDDLPKTEEMIRKKYEKIKKTLVPRLTKTWKCTKLCHQGKTTFDGTNIPVLTEFRRDARGDIGSEMTKCEQINFEIERRGIDWVTENMSRPGHNVADYKAPGEIK